MVYVSIVDSIYCVSRDMQDNLHKYRRTLNVNILDTQVLTLQVIILFD